MLDAGFTIDIALSVWFALVFLSVTFVAWDAFTRNPELLVMRYGWVLVTLYTGPIGGALYVLSCQEPSARTHERFITPLWKQGLGSTIHCIAGDATGIVAAAAVTAALGLPIGPDTVIEYAFGFAFGLLIFQALFMRGVMGGSYLGALRQTILSEWLSMNAVMAGMIPVMILLMTRHTSAMEPSSVRFWGVMSLATLVGLAVAYPVNVWLVAAGLKHGMGTVRAFGAGGSPMGASSPHAAMELATPASVGGATPESVPVAVRATRSQIVAVAVLTLVALAAGVLLSALYGDFAMRAAAPM